MHDLDIWVVLLIIKLQKGVSLNYLMIMITVMLMLMAVVKLLVMIMITVKLMIMVCCDKVRGIVQEVFLVLLDLSSAFDPGHLTPSTMTSYWIDSAHAVE